MVVYLFVIEEDLMATMRISLIKIFSSAYNVWLAFYRCKPEKMENTKNFSSFFFGYFFESGKNGNVLISFSIKKMIRYTKKSKLIINCLLSRF